jgi:hypothetical protein
VKLTARRKNATIKGIVVKGATGEPIAGAAVRAAEERVGYEGGAMKNAPGIGRANQRA